MNRIKSIPKEIAMPVAFSALGLAVIACQALPETLQSISGTVKEGIPFWNNLPYEQKIGLGGLAIGVGYLFITGLMELGETVDSVIKFFRKNKKED